MIEQEPVPPEEQPPAETPDAPEEPSADLTTGLTGDGPNNFGLSSGKGGGNSGRIGGPGGKNSGSRWGWYAAKVQNAIAAALRSHPSTRSAAFSMNVRIWPDRAGRITRAQLVGTSGNPSVDEAIRNQVLVGIMLPEPPPADLRLPIVLRMSARKP